MFLCTIYRQPFYLATSADQGRRSDGRARGSKGNARAPQTEDERSELRIKWSWGSGVDWPVGLPGWGPKGPPQQGFPWVPSVLEEKYFKWLIFDELYDSDKTTSFCNNSFKSYLCLSNS